MLAIAQQHCLNHPSREAVARCPECRQFYCRECVTEHDDRVICAACLRQLAAKEKKGSGHFAGFTRFAACVAGFFVATLVFYLIGRELISLPSSFHDGSIWQVPIGGEE